MDIETYLYRIDPYRSTDARPRWPLPLVRGPMDRATLARLQDPKSSKLRQQIIAVMDAHNITFERHVQVDSCTKPAYPDGHLAQQILLLSVTIADNETTNKLSDARRAIGNLLSTYGLDHIRVELVDQKRAFRLSLLPIHPNTNPVRVYDHCREGILGLLHSEFATLWTTVSLYRVYRPSQKIVAAVVVTVRPYTEADWQSLKAQVINTLKRGYKELDVPPNDRAPIDVEFIPGGFSLLPDAEDPKDPPYVSIGAAKDLTGTLTQYPKMGDGLGIAGTRGGGTIGGFFKLTVGEAVHRGLLTNYHVTDPNFEKPDGHADAFGVSYKDSAFSSRMAYPIREDVEATLEAATEMKNDWETKLEKTKNDRHQLILWGKSTAGLDRTIAATQAIVDTNARIQNTCNTMPQEFGDVLISSGRALSAQQEILDWAFVRCAQRATWEGPSGIRDMNVLPLATQFKGSRARRNLGQLSRPLYGNVDPQMQIQGFSDMVKGQWYFKVGRTSEITTGICNGTEANTNISHIRQVYDEQGSPREAMFCKTSADYVVLNALLREDQVGFDSFEAAQQEDFSRKGDSGALVIDAEGFCAGVLFGGLSGYANDINKWSANYKDAGLVTTMSSVRHSIESKTMLVRQENGQVARTGLRGHLSLGHR